MKNFLDQLVVRHVQWLADDAPENQIAISSQIRFSRNIHGLPFPAQASGEQLENVYELTQHALSVKPEFANVLSARMNEMDEVSKQILLERHLISSTHADVAEGAGIFVAPDEAFSLMVNGEDHILIQGLRPGVRLEEIYEELTAIDDHLDQELGFSYREDIGYLTACPTNVGTGLRVSVLLHLPGLVFVNQIRQIMNSLNKLGLVVRGLFGDDNSKSDGHLFQISNQSTLGETEAQIISRLTKIVNQVIGHEKNARRVLLDMNRNFIYDQIGRAYGTLKNAYLLDSKEALATLSVLRLGVGEGILASLTLAHINDLIVITQPGHLQKYAGRELRNQEGDAYRATLVRNKLRGFDQNKTL